MPQSLACMPVHFVFSTKGREPWIQREWAGRLYEYIGGIVRTEKSLLLQAGGVEGHVHLLIALGREVSLAEMMRLVKANSSKWVHETFRDRPFGWQGGYRAFAVSHAHLGPANAYIAGQREHHASLTFQDEYRGLLREHGPEWDERYVWD